MLLDGPALPQGGVDELEAGQQAPAGRRGAPRLRCSACGQVLAAPAQPRLVGGDYGGARTNPAGLAFRLRYYVAAPGCRASGGATAAHSWFPPFAWRVLTCAACGVHSGWQFGEPAAGGFVALIGDRIREEYDH